jgi:hypothetical protein
MTAPGKFIGLNISQLGQNKDSILSKEANTLCILNLGVSFVKGNFLVLLDI